MATLASILPSVILTSKLLSSAWQVYDQHNIIAGMILDMHNIPILQMEGIMCLAANEIKYLMSVKTCALANTRSRLMM